MDRGAEPLRPTWRVHVHRAPPDGRAAHEAATLCARHLGVPLADARALLSAAPLSLPRALPEGEARALAQAFGKVGLPAEARSGYAGGIACPAHPRLHAEDTCARCSARLCVVCRVAAGGEARCPRCVQRVGASRRFRNARIVVLLAVLFVTMLWGYATLRRRAARTEWSRTLRVAVVLLQADEVPGLDPSLLTGRLPALARVLEGEFRRHGRAGDAPPFEFYDIGLVQVGSEPPAAVRNAAWYARAKHAWSLWRYLGRVHDAAGMDPGAFDARIYVVLAPPDGTRGGFVEGEAETGGEVGIVRTALTADTVDGAVIAIAHELFHVLGAHDKYDFDGNPVAPEGLAEPHRTPLFPQRYGEIMAGAIATGPGSGTPIWRLDDLRVGDATAVEIGWLAAE